jgi:hypothetical protein
MSLMAWLSRSVARASSRWVGIPTALLHIVKRPESWRRRGIRGMRLETRGRAILGHVIEPPRGSKGCWTIRPATRCRLRSGEPMSLRGDSG